jgi:hypothetical protein
MLVNINDMIATVSSGEPKPVEAMKRIFGAWGCEKHRRG